MRFLEFWREYRNCARCHFDLWTEYPLEGILTVVGLMVMFAFVVLVRGWSRR